MLLEAFVKEKVNESTIVCIVAIGNFKTIEQQFFISNRNVEVEDILYRVIYIEYDFDKTLKGIQKGARLYFVLDQRLHILQNALKVVKN